VQLNNNIVQLNDRLIDTQSELINVYNSKSWWITKPLRRLFGLLGK
jgi:hypothetical protein